MVADGDALNAVEGGQVDANRVHDGRKGELTLQWLVEVEMNQWDDVKVVLAAIVYMPGGKLPPATTLPRGQAAEGVDEHADRRRLPLRRCGKENASPSKGRRAAKTSPPLSWLRGKQHQGFRCWRCVVPAH